MAYEMQYKRWNPWRDAANLQAEVNRLFETRNPAVRAEESYYPTLDVLRSKDEFVVRVDLPGLTKEDIELTVINNRLSVRGERKNNLGADEQYQTHRIESRYGAFERTVDLPARVDGEKVKARFTDGVLEITAPLQEEAKPRTIPLEVQ